MALKKLRDVKRKTAELNKIVSALKGDSKSTIKELMDKTGIPSANFYTGMKKLQNIGRLDKGNNRNVISPVPVTEEEYLLTPDPYNRKGMTPKPVMTPKPAPKPAPTKRGRPNGSKNKKAAHKTKKKRTAALFADDTGQITTPIELPIDREPDEITIKGTPQALKNFLHLMGV